MWKWMGGKWRVPKLLLNQGPSEPCYATGGIVSKRMHMIIVKLFKHLAEDQPIVF